MANRYIPKQSKDKNLEIRRTYYQTNKEHINELRRIRNKKNKDKVVKQKHAWLLKNEYDMTANEYETLLIQQNYSCAICKRHESNFKKRLAVDHDHETGEIRGLLCNNCNNGLGRFKDNVDTLESAIDYLLAGNISVYSPTDEILVNQFDQGPFLFDLNQGPILFDK